MTIRAARQHEQSSERGSGGSGGGWGVRLLRIAGRHRWWILATAALGFVTTGSGIGLIALAAYLLSRAAVETSTEDLALVITGVRTFAVTRVVARYLERYVGHLGTFRTLTRIRVWLFRSLEPLAPAALVDDRHGDLVARIADDVDTLQDVSLRVAVPPIVAALTTALAASILGVWSPWLAVTLVAFALLCGVAIPLLTRHLVRGPAATSVTAAAEVTALVVEGLDGIDELVAAGREDLLVDRVDGATGRQLDAQDRLARVRATGAALAGLATGACATVVLAIGAGLLADGGIHGVTLAVLPLVALAAFESVQPLATAVEHWDRSAAAAGRILELADRDPAVRDPAHPVDAEPVHGAPDVELVDVRFGHAGVNAAGAGAAGLDGASLRVPAGATVALVGPSGAGKSTIVDLLLRFRAPDDGVVRVQGVDLATGTGAAARDRVAVVAQHDHLFDTTVRDNLLVGDGSADDDRLWAALSAAAADDLVRALPDGLDERLGEDGDRLSGGERQRLMVARALLADAPVLVLDEATAHLDAATRDRVLAGVRRWRPGRTTIVIAHDAAGLAGIDRVLRVEGGRVEDETS